MDRYIRESKGFVSDQELLVWSAVPRIKGNSGLLE
jgi:hypothetical protein